MSNLGYISVDKLIDFVNNHINKTIDANDIARFPRADVEEVRHAKWMDGNKVCSNCKIEKPCVKVIRGFDQILYEYKGEVNYCPNCGAIMDKEKEE